MSVALGWLQKIINIIRTWSKQWPIIFITLS
jgi:hypothetical protein